jgi:hypothetical protein
MAVSSRAAKAEASGVRRTVGRIIFINNQGATSNEPKPGTMAALNQLAQVI